jgi:hypothetical protein
MLNGKTGGLHESAASSHSTLNIQHSTFNIELSNPPAPPLIHAPVVAEPWATNAVGRADCDTRHTLV